MDFSIQLYSFRNESSLDNTLETLKTLGYTQVEGWGGQFADAASLNASLKRAGLPMPTAHIGFAQLAADIESAARIAKDIGIKTIYVPAPPNEYREGKKGWQDFANDLARVGKELNAKGVAFGFHNHDHEFVKGADGKYPMELILEASPAIEWEMDLAWAVKGGQDPVKWIEKYGDRITAVHVKDIAKAGEALDEDGWADVGHGTLDWKSLLATIKAKTRAKYFVAEHDKPNDAPRFARRSIVSVKKWM